METDLSMEPPQKANSGPLPTTYKWKLTGKYKSDFPAHFTMVYISNEVGYYLLGGNGNVNTCLLFDLKTIKYRAQMPQEKTFFSAVHVNGIIYTFGGYDAYDKV